MGCNLNRTFCDNSVGDDCGIADVKDSDVLRLLEDGTVDGSLRLAGMGCLRLPFGLFAGIQKIQFSVVSLSCINIKLQPYPIYLFP